MSLRFRLRLRLASRRGGEAAGERDRDRDRRIGRVAAVRLRELLFDLRFTLLEDLPRESSLSEELPEESSLSEESSLLLSELLELELEFELESEEPESESEESEDEWRCFLFFSTFSVFGESEGGDTLFPTCSLILSSITFLLARRRSSRAACCSLAWRMRLIEEPSTKSALIFNADFRLSFRS